MRRRVFNLASAVSLLLFGATVVLWVRSYWVGERFYVPHRTHSVERFWTVMSGAGSLAFGVLTDPSPDSTSIESWSYERIVPRGVIRNIGTWFAGFGFFQETIAIFGFVMYSSFVVVPYWLPCLILLSPTGVRMYRWRRRIRRQQSHQCPMCGYDLKGNISGICPECGTAVAGKAGA